jgi:hypothetical protein
MAHSTSETAPQGQRIWDHEEFPTTREKTPFLSLAVVAKGIPKKGLQIRYEAPCTRLRRRKIGSCFETSADRRRVANEGAACRVDEIGRNLCAGHVVSSFISHLATVSRWIWLPITCSLPDGRHPAWTPRRVNATSLRGFVSKPPREDFAYVRHTGFFEDSQGGPPLVGCLELWRWGGAAGR